MGPSYARIKGFDESYTKFASKYSLYLYREQHKDKIPNEGDFLDGVPVLFIPGNAGSYRQVRAIAARVSELYYDEHDKYKKINPNFKNLDVFAGDFNEDFTAFHGRTILDQAEYLNEAIKFILDLYSSNPSPPKSVIIVGHSMGGIVARVMITLPNYVDNSINTILTLSSPHAAAPLTFDGDILKIYSAIDRFWYEGYNPKSTSEYGEIAHERVKDISLISITGGGLDSTLPADYTSLGFLIPPNNGFTVFTTGTPNVWTPIDHLAIVWCSQLRQFIAESLLEVIDSNAPGKTYPLEKRMRIFRKHFLSGFENYQSQDYESYTRSNLIEVDLKGKTTNKVKQLNMGADYNQYNMFELEKGQHFSLLASVPLGKYQDKANTVVLLCTKGNTLSCVDVSPDMVTIPRSTKDTNSLEDSTFGGSANPFYGLEFNSTILDNYDTILVIQNGELGDDFIVAELNQESSINYKLNASGLSMLGGASLTIPKRALSINIQIPGAWNSILVYKLRLSRLVDGKFTSFMRQWKDEPFESKWYINLTKEKSIGLSMHGIAPFVPFKVKSESYSHAINIQLWSDVTGRDAPLTVNISIDLVSSLRLLVLRYRISIVSMIVAIISMVILFQFRSYGSGKTFPSFINVIAMIHRRGWWILLTVLIMIQPIVTIPFVQHVLNFIDPVVIQDFNEINLSLHPDFKLNSFYLGLDEGFTLVGIILYLIANFLIIITYLVLRILGALIHYVVDIIPVRASRGSSKYRRVIATLLLIGSISTYLPYQIGYAMCCVIQAMNVVKNWKQRQDLNYQLSILLLMLWILPINIPIVIVYIHNLAVNWKTPFSSHHNLLSIVPIVLFVQTNSLLKLPRVKPRYVKVLSWYLAYVIMYAVLYGGRHTYWLHHLMNLLCCVLLLIFYDHDEDDEQQELQCK
ncbi:uncharacterized protein SPAPADRAFT_48058 [Spathaspora passalidarum NRRL Y-27907]|uniref:GPI inositol-deacylase n=1 Tax=Spathaspora passalidarum (strain NRRL Y-27907 / 11-Y1) TaxID=619300 RepID=G3AFL3_SPAPN|nr:uncharacterized protein SPAPADRAFT_48058 [Spathaspora passalidarum NRRL Y-27907]EGW35002.1 hypothetical protein SPAPADRAFT_48058 [Spathaspora passalidarum NRRL Y-27907]